MAFSSPSSAGFWLLPLMAVTVTGVAHAQVDKPPESNTPSAEGLTYRSALANYRPYSAQQVRPWRESNDNVGRIGGWRAYAKEMNQNDGNPSPEAEAGTPANQREGKQ
jgi:hypothetical protein